MVSFKMFFKNNKIKGMGGKTNVQNAKKENAGTSPFKQQGVV